MTQDDLDRIVAIAVNGDSDEKTQLAHYLGHMMMGNYKFLKSLAKDDSLLVQLSAQEWLDQIAAEIEAGGG